MTVPTHASQRGAALLISLIVMSIILLLVTSATRYTMASLKMSLNDEIRVSTREWTQAVMDGAISIPANFPMDTLADHANCSATYPADEHSPCDSFSARLPAEVMAHLGQSQAHFRAERLAPDLTPPPRGLGTSLRAFGVARYELEAVLDRRDDGLGHARIREGLIVILPRSEI